MFGAVKNRPDDAGSDKTAYGKPFLNFVIIQGVSDAIEIFLWMNMFVPEDV